MSIPSRKSTKATPNKRLSRKATARLVVILLTLIIVALIVATCSKDHNENQINTQAVDPGSKDAPDGDGNGTIEPAEEPLEEAVKPYVYPLTGQPSDMDVVDRPIMVMVENSPAARPQTGLNQADIVIEVLAEGEITRFLSVFQSQSPEIIGPVRSIRPYFVQLGEALDAVMVHAGWSQEAMNLLAAHKLAHFDEVYGDGQYYWRDSSRKMPHNLYTAVNKIKEGIANKGLRTDWKTAVPTFIAKGAEPQPAGMPVTQLTIPYLHGYEVEYAYDAASGLYTRSMENQVHNDRESGLPLTAANILIVETSHRIVDDVGRREVNVFGPGKGYLVQKGKYTEVEWQNKDGLIRAYIDGTEQPLLPGQTWIQIVPIGTEVTFTP